MAYTFASPCWRSSSMLRLVRGATSTWPGCLGNRWICSFGSPRSRGRRPPTTCGRSRSPPAGAVWPGP
eukprot:155482-Alexandrium_andersonii.AAC.1